jgi:hypothetical protein
MIAWAEGKVGVGETVGVGVEVAVGSVPGEAILVMIS